jgi:N-acetylmuramoyl-L-alanine amidase
MTFWLGAAGAVAGDASEPDGLHWVSTDAGRGASLESLAGCYGLVPEMDPAAPRGWMSRLKHLFVGRRGEFLRLTDAQHHLAFSPGSRRLTFNQRTVWLNGPTLRLEGAWGAHAADIGGVIAPLLRPGEYLRGRGSRVVVLDPGHGGADEGARSARGMLEKDVVLDLARRLRVQLVHAGLKVYMTRDNDRKIELPDRSAMAREWKADLFVSIHANKAGNTKAQGLESYVLPAAGWPSTSARSLKPGEGAPGAGNEHDAANTILGWCLHDALLAKTGATDRGVKRARFVVLREAPCPAVLVECGFLSNPEEAARLGNGMHREDLAAALAHGILNYTGIIDRARLSDTR